MIKGRDFIVFSDDWGRHPFSCQHIVTHLLPHNRVLWVNTIGLRRPRLTLKDLARCGQKLRSFVAKPARQRLPDNLTIINPPMLPFANRLVRAANRRSVVDAVKKNLRLLGMTAPIVLFTVPNASEYLGAFEEDLAVYYCVDEFSEWPGVDRDLVIDLEAKLLRQVDLVAAVSDFLVSSKIASKGPTLLLTHGVDVEHFRADRLPPLLSGVTPPVIGYFGLIDERTDQDLVVALLTRHPDWSLVFIGKSVVDLSRLTCFGNFRHLDAVSYGELPRYAAGFSVCLLPYVRTKLTDNINPLKLKEYLATGKPVVTTALPEAVKLAGWGVHIGYDPDSIINQIEAVLSRDSWDPARQIAFLDQESWLSKAEQLSGWIGDALGAKKTTGKRTL